MEDDKNMQNITIEQDDVKQNTDVDEEVATSEETSIEETEEVPAAETETEPVPETEPEAETDNEYDWETDINKRVAELENSIKSLLVTITTLEASVAKINEEANERKKKLSGFWKPVEGKIADESQPKTINDLYTVKIKNT